MNVVVLQGTLSRAPEERLLPSGDRMVAFEVTSRRDGERAESVPVVWFGAPARAATIPVGAVVVALGRVRRRWFRTPAGTQSRTEVVADEVITTRQVKKVGALLDRAVGLLESSAGGDPPGL